MRMFFHSQRAAAFRRRTIECYAVPLCRGARPDVPDTAGRGHRAPPAAVFAAAIAT
ncbi:hypothetical protein SBBP1_20041 [Burkholderiales bacterium]|nr:hypothetical protein SBBP1_20041 [Burkholderiales bacterium]